MAFRYINPGYVSLLDNDASASVQIVNRKRSKTGIAFTQNDSKVGITLPGFEKGNEFWGRFDFSILNNNYNTYIFFWFPNTEKTGFHLLYPYSPTNTLKIMHYYNYNSHYEHDIGNFNDLGMKDNAINTVVFHAILADRYSARLEIFLGNKKFIYTDKSMIYSESCDKKAILCAKDNPDVAFSNIIFSSEEISPKEQTLALPISATETDMTLGDNGIYIADAANQSLLQSVDVSSLIENYGASSAITGIQLVGNPAYKTAEGLANLTALSKKGDVITEHNTHSLSDNTSSMIMDGRTIDNMTIADLQNMQFGWKVGE